MGCCSIRVLEYWVYLRIEVTEWWSNALKSEYLVLSNDLKHLSC